jgi:hypothetical protein
MEDTSGSPSTGKLGVLTLYALVSACVCSCGREGFLLQEVRGKRLAKASFECHDRPDFRDEHARWGVKLSYERIYSEDTKQESLSTKEST